MGNPTFTPQESDEFIVLTYFYENTRLNKSHGLDEIRNKGAARIGGVGSFDLIFKKLTTMGFFLLDDNGISLSVKGLDYYSRLFSIFRANQNSAETLKLILKN